MTFTIDYTKSYWFKCLINLRANIRFLKFPFKAINLVVGIFELKKIQKRKNVNFSVMLGRNKKVFCDIC